jgi:DNA-binding MarR family transcriptional regulator
LILGNLEFGDGLHLRELFSDLVRFETELWDAVDEHLRTEVELPLNWFEPMLVIDQLAGCRVHDIAEALSITVGGTSKLVDRIESAGLCRRRPNPDDRRSSLITLTAAGQKRLAAATAEFDAELARRFAAVPASTLDRFHAVLRRLRTAGRTLDELDNREAIHA